jgi:uncharacterized membrane protein YfcA
LTTESLIYFLLLALLAEVLGTVGGFGSSLFFVPIAAFFLDFHSVLGITAIFHVSSNVIKIGLFRHGVDRHLILSFGVPAVAFVILGAWLSRFVDTRVLELSLSIFLIAVSLIFLLLRQVALKPTKTNSAAGGALSGLVAGLLGTGGAIRGITLAAYDLPKETFIATSALIDLGIDLSRTAVYSLKGYIHTQDLYLIPFLFGVSLAGTYIGKRILNQFSERQFKIIVLWLVMITGVVTLVKFA